MAGSPVPRIGDSRGRRLVGAVASCPRRGSNACGRRVVAASVGLLLAGTVLSSIFIFGPAHRRLKELETAAIRLGAGDLTVRAHDDGGDEVARVARAFNQMAEDLAAPPIGRGDSFSPTYRTS